MGEALITSIIPLVIVIIEFIIQMSVLLQRGEEFIGIVRRKEERTILFPLTFRREKRQDREVGLAFRWDRVALEASGQDENLVPQPVEDVYPLFGFERDAVDVANPTDDHPDVHCVRAPADEWALSRPRALSTDRPKGCLA